MKINIYGKKKDEASVLCIILIGVYYGDFAQAWGGVGGGGGGFVDAY